MGTLGQPWSSKVGKVVGSFWEPCGKVAGSLWEHWSKAVGTLEQPWSKAAGTLEQTCGNLGNLGGTLWGKVVGTWTKIVGTLWEPWSKAVGTLRTLGEPCGAKLWEPCGTKLWEPCGTKLREPCGNVGAKLWGPCGTKLWEPWELWESCRNLGNLVGTWREPWNLVGTSWEPGGMSLGAAPACSETFTMAEDPKACCCWGKKATQKLPWISSGNLDRTVLTSLCQQNPQVSVALASEMLARGNRIQTISAHDCCCAMLRLDAAGAKCKPAVSTKTQTSGSV